jgi:hypothetical protein
LSQHFEHILLDLLSGPNLFCVSILYKASSNANSSGKGDFLY